MHVLHLINMKELTAPEIKREDRLGVMRIDWSDRRISNQWFPTERFEILCGENEISISLLQEEINQIIFEQLKDFSTVINLCRGDSYKHECTYYVQGKEVNYYVRLMPVRDAYSSIMVYL